MLGKFDWIKLLFGLLSKTTQIILGRAILISIFIFAFLFPTQYSSCSKIFIKAMIEEGQKEIAATFQPMIDNYIKSLKR